MPAAWTTVLRMVPATAASLAVLAELGLMRVMICGMNWAISGNSARKGTLAPCGVVAAVGIGDGAGCVCVAPALFPPYWAKTVAALPDSSSAGRLTHSL